MALGSLISSVASANQFKIDQVMLHSLAEELMTVSDADKLSGVFFRFLGQAVKGIDPLELVRSVNEIEVRWRSVAAEGAAMGFAVMDIVLGKKTRWSHFKEQIHPCYLPSLYVGRGMAIGLIKPRCHFHNDVEESMFSWLTIDGMGFSQAFLHHLHKLGKYQGQLPLHDCDEKTHQSIFDQGVGRFLWLNHGHELPVLVKIVSKQDKHRLADLWSGIGAASTFLGAVDKENMQYLKQEAGIYAPDLAVGATLACKIRLADGSRMPHLNDVIETLCGINAQECAELSEQMMDKLSPYGVDINGIHYSNYHVWRKRLREFF
ncbi:MAG: DUF1702 family protein [Candidatus Obscuribacterales bacterium]|nr:DUF1702 family protein [Candidatus Obscuribacterales bacterium]